jgi:hypothetical protein
MSSPLFLEFLEERALLSGPTADFGTPFVFPSGVVRVGTLVQDDIRQHSGELSTRFASLASDLSTRQLEAGLTDFPGKVTSATGLGSGEAAFLLSEAADLRPSGDRVDGFLPQELFLLASSVGNHMRPLDPNDPRLMLTAMDNSVVNALESTAGDKNSEEDFREEHGGDPRHQDLDANTTDHGLGIQGVNGFLVGNSTRSLDDLLTSLDLTNPIGGMDSALLPGPLTDSIILDGWREAVPAPQADLVRAAGGDLSVLPAFLVANAALATSNQPPPAVESGPTDFIVGLAASRLDQAKGQRIISNQDQSNQDQALRWNSDLSAPLPTPRSDLALPNGEQTRSISTPGLPQALPSAPVPNGEVAADSERDAEGTFPAAEVEGGDSD